MDCQERRAICREGRPRGKKKTRRFRLQDLLPLPQTFPTQPMCIGSHPPEEKPSNSMVRKDHSPLFTIPPCRSDGHGKRFRRLALGIITISRAQQIQRGQSPVSQVNNDYGRSQKREEQRDLLQAVEYPILRIGRRPYGSNPPSREKRTNERERDSSKDHSRTLIA